LLIIDCEGVCELQGQQEIRRFGRRTLSFYASELHFSASCVRIWQSFCTCSDEDGGFLVYILFNILADHTDNTKILF
jgi:hypothetical protein